jgi:hypothetical protein
MSPVAPQPLARHAYEALMAEWSTVFNALLKTNLWKLRRKMDSNPSRLLTYWNDSLDAERQRDPEAARLEQRHSEIVRQIEQHREALGFTD